MNLSDGMKEISNINRSDNVSVKQDLYILLISCESKRIIERDQFPTDLELFNWLIKNRNDINFNNVFAQDELYNINNVDGIIIGGSSASVYNNEKWMDRIREQIKTIKLNNIPLLWCCFWAQIIAEALWWKVVKGKELELWVKRIYFTETGKRDPLFYNLPDAVDIISSHEDDIYDIGREWCQLAYNSVSFYQGYSVWELIRGVQFHPEYNIDTINKIEDIYNVGKTERDRQHDWHQIIDNFLNNIVYKNKYK